MKSLEIGKEYKTEEIYKAYRDYGRTRIDPYPLVYCYNTSNFKKFGHGRMC